MYSVQCTAGYTESEMKISFERRKPVVSVSVLIHFALTNGLRSKR